MASWTIVIVAQTTSLRGPIRKHEDLLKLIDMPSHASSTSHSCKRCCKRVTDGDKSNMSSAYKIMWQPFTDDSNFYLLCVLKHTDSYFNITHESAPYQSNAVSADGWCGLMDYRIVHCISVVSICNWTDTLALFNLHELCTTYNNTNTVRRRTCNVYNSPPEKIPSQFANFYSANFFQEASCFLQRPDLSMEWTPLARRPDSSDI